MAPGCRGGGEGVTCSISSCWVLSAELFSASWAVFTLMLISTEKPNSANLQQWCRLPRIKDDSHIGHACAEHMGSFPSPPVLPANPILPAAGRAECEHTSRCSPAISEAVPSPRSPLVSLQQQQLQAQHLSHAAHGPPVQLPPHPSGLQPPGIPPVTGSSSGLLALGALGSQAHLAVKDEKNHHDLDHRGESFALPAPGAGVTPGSALRMLVFSCYE